MWPSSHPRVSWARTLSPTEAPAPTVHTSGSRRSTTCRRSPRSVKAASWGTSSWLSPRSTLCWEAWTDDQHRRQPELRRGALTGHRRLPGRRPDLAAGRRRGGHRALPAEALCVAASAAPGAVRRRFRPPRGIELCADLLDLTGAEVSGVATFYSQYKRHPNGKYTIGVCTNTLCAIMGGDEIWDFVSAHLGIGHDETTADGLVTLERIECNAACDYAPVVMANWEFFDNQTPESTKALADSLRSGIPVTPTRGASKVCTFKEVSRVLAGFGDGLADAGVGAGPASLVGLKAAKAQAGEATK